MEKIETLGHRLAELMQERSLNYERLGLLLEMKPQTLNRYVLGQREPKARVVTEMAMRLQVDPMWLQGYDVAKNTPAADPLRQPGEPLVPILGTIKAGIPNIAQQEILGYAAASVPDGDGYFYLQVSGDSMKNAGIQPGDRVLIRQQDTAEDGQIVACLVDHENATLKRFHRQGDWVILQPENQGYAPRILPMKDFENGTARIIGVAVRLMREL